MKILVTGGAGFIGSEFVRQIINKHKVIVIDKLTYAGDLERLRDCPRGSLYAKAGQGTVPAFVFYKSDICNQKAVESIFKQEKPEIVVNFSAETHVDRSIQDSSPFINTNIRGTQVLLDCARNHNIEKFVHVSCYDAKTRALTTEGLKNYKELKIGDLVYSLNPATKEIEIRPIEKIITQTYNGKMIHFDNKRIDLLVTPNHRMFIFNTSKKERSLVIEAAEEAMHRSIFYMPEGHWSGKEDEEFYLEGHGKVKTKDLMYILGIFIGDGFIAYQEKRSATKTGLPRKEYLINSRDTDSGRFKVIEKIGDHDTICHGYRIFFDIPENDKSRKKVEQALTNLRVKYHCHKGKAGTHLYFTSKVFIEFFAQCGQKAHNKQIPRWALDYSPKYLRYLFDGLMDSDGHRGIIYHTVSTKLASNICELCVKLNLKPTLRKKHSKSFLNGRKIEGDSYYVFVATTKKSISRHRCKLVDYTGDIWCLKVKDNKNFLVERNGKFDFCGNTDEVYGDIEKGKFSEDHPLVPNSPYSASKAAADLLIKSYVRTYGFPAVIVRPSNNYGPWQYPEKLIPVVIYKALTNEAVPVYAKGLNVREWLYVSDCAKGIQLILKKGKTGEIYNLGSGQEKTNIEVVKKILDILDKSHSLIKFVKDRPGHDIRYSLDSSKLRRLGWKPEQTFGSGLKETVNWYVSNLSWLENKVRYLRNYWKRVYK